MNEDKFNLGQLQICVEKHLKKHSDNLNNIDDHKLRAAFLKQFIWPQNSNIKIWFIETSEHNSGNVPRKNYEDSTKVDPLQNVVNDMSVKDAIIKIVNERYVPIIGNGITVTFVDNIEDSNIRISFVPSDGAWSYVGTQCADPENKDLPTMNLGWFDVATTLHEFGHCFGMVHEHNNPNNNPIKWDKEKVYAWALSDQGWDKETTDENILMNYDMDKINGSVFDPLSIMLYFFPAYLTTNGVGTKQNFRFSGYDVEFLNKNYPNSSIHIEQFYQNIYGETIEDSIAKSTNLLSYKPDPMKMYIKILSGVGIVIFVILIMYFLLG